MEDVVKWISAERALKHVEDHLGSRIEAKRSLADYLRDGGLRARAKEVWLSKASTRSAAMRSDSEKNDLQADVDLTVEMFRASQRWGKDVSDWRWPKNHFFVTVRRGRKSKWRVFKGVELCSNDIDMILRKKLPSRGGRPRRRDDWDEFWMAVIEVAVDGELGPRLITTT